MVSHFLRECTSKVNYHSQPWSVFLFEHSKPAATPIDVYTRKTNVDASSAQRPPPTSPPEKHVPIRKAAFTSRKPIAEYVDPSCYRTPPCIRGCDVHFSTHRKPLMLYASSTPTHSNNCPVSERCESVSGYLAKNDIRGVASTRWPRS